MATTFFGSGTLQAFRTDITNATPLNFGILQDVSVDFSGDMKELYGQNAIAAVIARGKIKIGIKAKVGVLSGLLFNALFFGQTMATGQIATSYGEAASVPASTPWQITVANAATFSADYGVSYAATGLPLTKVASAPTVGQYSVNSATGVYTFSTSDASAAMVFNYTYGITAVGEKFTMINPLMGAAPVFQLNLYGYNLGKPATLTFLQVVCPKLAMASKNDDFMIPELDFGAFANAANQVFTWSQAEAS